MKTFIAASLLTFSASSFAQMVFPNVYNHSTSIEVQVWNRTNKNISCSGSVDMTLSDGSYEVHSYFEWIFSFGFRNTYIYPRSIGKTITRGSNNIFCY